MSKTALMLLGSISLFAFGSTAMAASPSQQQCEAQNGTFDRSGGQVTCTITTTKHVGNSDNSQTQTITDTEQSNGTFNNNPQKKDPPPTCTNGVGGSQNCPK
jgi:hypothetical protein